MFTLCPFPNLYASTQHTHGSSPSWTFTTHLYIGNLAHG